MNRAPPPAPTIVGRRARYNRGIGVKRIPGARRNKKLKIKRKIQNPQNIGIKHRRNVVRKMTVCRRGIFPAL